MEKKELEDSKFHPDERLSSIDIEKEMRESFLAYSMSVIVQRALPDVRDGLKPVHRRILYTQFEKGLTHDKPYHKCADTVGSVLGSYHPHGDASVYDALVRLAQTFSMRYPLVDGHGNFGSIDGDPPAAYRYTEARLSRITLEMLSDINKDTVDFGPNYDDRLTEPLVLPARFPNLLVNGSVGIAVGMATNIPPHNFGEVADAIQLMIRNPEATAADIAEVIPGPDFPTGGIIMGRAGIKAAYLTGRGKLTLRGRAEFRDVKNHPQIVITEIPYMVKKDDIVAEIDSLIKDGKLPGASFRRDESDRNGMKIVVYLKANANADIILNTMYSYTQLQVTNGVIMLALVDGQPKILSLKQILDHYLSFQEEIITRRANFELKKARARAHLLQGFMLAIDNIDEIIAILKSSRNIPEGKARLTERFANVDLSVILTRAMENYGTFEFPYTLGLSDEQADAIVAMRLGQLTGLEKDKIAEELAALMNKIAELLGILSDRTKVLEIISEELSAIRKKYADGRRTLIEDVDGEVIIEDLIPVQDCIITFTDIGYIKRQPVEEYNTQGRGGRGVAGMKQRDEDFVKDMCVASTHDNVLFVSNKGNMFKLKGYEIPEGGRQSRGTNIVNLLQLGEDERIEAMMKTADFAENRYFICATKRGIVKRTGLDEFRNIRKGAPLRAILLQEDDEIASAHLTNGDTDVIIATRGGKAIHFSEKALRPQGRIARGVRGIRLLGEDFVVGATKVFGENNTILTVTDKGIGRRTAVSDYPRKGRGGQGNNNYKPNADRGFVIGIKTLYEDDDVLLINDKGVIIRFRANDLRVMGRTAGGVRVMRIEDDGRVVAFTRTEHDDEAETEELSMAEQVESEMEAEAETDDNDEDTEEIAE